jgi:signal transduction histidine kinase
LQHLSAQVKYAIGELHRIAMNLRPAILDDLGLVPALNWYFREFEMATPHIKVERDVSLAEADVTDAAQKIAIFRIVQEATANALKHAEATVIKVALSSAEGVIRLAIEDNGRGFDVARKSDRVEPGHGIGMQSMKERAELSGGRYDLQSAPGQGTHITVAWHPLQSSGEQCPVIPISRTLAQSMCRSPLPGGQLSDEHLICLACVRTLCPSKQEHAT